MCLTVPDLVKIQPYVFLTPGENNAKEDCKCSFDLGNWKLTNATSVPSFATDDTEFEVAAEG